jgi:two-component system, NarL family, response regulator NreC
MEKDFNDSLQTNNTRISEGALCPHCIILADDHFFFRRDLRKMLERRKDLQVVGEAGDGLELVELLKKETPHLVILDISMPQLGGLEAARYITGNYPGVSVLFLTMHKNLQYQQEAIATGARGYVLKENIDREIFSAIDTIRNGGTFFPKFNNIYS